MKQAPFYSKMPFPIIGGLLPLFLAIAVGIIFFPKVNLPDVLITVLGALLVAGGFVIFKILYAQGLPDKEAKNDKE